MARLLVASDSDLAVHVKILQNDEDGAYSAVCTCGPTDLLEDTHEQWSEEDAIQVATIHIDNNH